MQTNCDVLFLISALSEALSLEVMHSGRQYLPTRVYLVPVCKNDESLTSTKNEDLLWAVLPMGGGGTRWRSWLRHCAISRKVAGSIPDGVIRIFY